MCHSKILLNKSHTWYLTLVPLKVGKKGSRNFTLTMHIVHIMTIPFKGEDLTTPARSVECFDAASNCADVAERKGGCFKHGKESCKKVRPS